MIESAEFFYTRYQAILGFFMLRTCDVTHLAKSDTVDNEECSFADVDAFQQSSVELAGVTKFSWRV